MKKTSIVKIIHTICAVFCAIMLLWLVGASLQVTAEYEAAASYQEAENLNPFKSDSEKTPWEVRSQEVKSEFANGSWAVRIASGNADKDLSIMVVCSLLLGLISSVTGLIFIRFVKNKKAKARAKAKAKAENLKKADAEAKARKEKIIADLASGRLYPKK